MLERSKHAEAVAEVLTRQIDYYPLHKISIVSRIYQWYRNIVIVALQHFLHLLLFILNKPVITLTFFGTYKLLYCVGCVFKALAVDTLVSR